VEVGYTHVLNPFTQFLPQSKEKKQVQNSSFFLWLGYWVVKQAVGTKAWLLDKAVICDYLQEDNFLEIDVASSAVAWSVAGLVLYIASVVVDLAILIEEGIISWWIRI